MLQINNKDVLKGLKTLGLFGYLYLMGAFMVFVQREETILISFSLFGLFGILLSCCYLMFMSSIANWKLVLVISAFPWGILFYFTCCVLRV